MSFPKFIKQQYLNNHDYLDLEFELVV